MAILEVLMRYLHILAAVALVGGIAFMMLCVAPASKVLDDSQRKLFMQAVHARFLKIVWVAIIVLLVTGTYTWIRMNEAYSHFKPWGLALISTKVVLALSIFMMIWLRSIGVLGMTPRGSKRLRMANLHLAVTVILIASTLRYLRLTHGV